MTLRDLEYVLAVAEHGHFGRAAKACHVSQPTLSGQIKKLEDQLGVVIFERGRGGVTVTETGRAIVAHARTALDASVQIRAVARAAQDPLSGTLSLGLIPTIAPYLIPRFVARLRTELPALSVTYREDITDRLNRDLIEGTLDAAILATPPETDALINLPLYREPFHLVMPKGHGLEKKASIRMADVDREDLLLLTEGHCFRDQALAICEVPTGDEAQSLRATSLETLINLVAQGQGVTLVPALALRALPNDMNLVVRPIEDRGAAREISLTVRRSFPRRRLAERVSSLIRGGLPESVQIAG